MKFSMTGQDKDDCLIEVTPWVGLTVIAPCLSFQFLLPVYILWKVFFFQKLETLLNLNNTWIIIQWSFVNRKSKIDTIEEQSLEKKIWNNWTIKKTYWNCAIISELITCDTSALYVKTLKTIITVIVFIGNVIMYVTPVW